MNLQTFKPLNNLLLIELETEEKRLGITIPEQYRENNFGVVRGIGQGKKKKDGTFTPIPLHMGDRVMISPMGGRRELILDETLYWLIDADNILAIMEPEELSN